MLTRCRCGTVRRRCQSSSARFPRPFKAIEDQIEPEGELVRVVVTGLHDVLDGERGEVRVVVDGELLEEVFGDLGRLVRALER